TINTYETTATELIREDGQAPTRILATATPSEKRLGENIFPDPPREPEGKAFECSPCFYILPDSTRRPESWRSLSLSLLYYSLLSFRSANLETENTFFLIFDRTLVSMNRVVSTISCLRPGTSG